MAVRQPIWRDGVYGSASVLALSAVAFLAACTDTSTSLLPSALAPPAALQKKAGEPSNLEPLAAAHKANPADTAAALAYAKGLRTSGGKAEALAVLEASAKANPADRRLVAGTRPAVAGTW